MGSRGGAGSGFPLAAYLERIGLAGRPHPPQLAEVHRAHVSAIPFENLDPHRGVPVSLEPEALVGKLIHGRRGGYCFEQNLVLAAALEALGLRVEPMLARVRVDRPAGRVSPRTHLVLRVTQGDAVWLADVGFGNGTLPEPIPFGPGEAVYEQSGWRYRLVAEGRAHVLQTERDGAWTDLYEFIPEPVPFVDLETSNWFTASHPRSPFVTGLIVAAQRPDGARVMLSDWHGLALVRQTPAERTVIEIQRSQVPGLLETEFGLPGFSLSPEGRVVRSAEANL